MYDRGSIVIVPFPYTDASSTKSRPALVLSDRLHNDLTGDLVVCGITSKLTNAQWTVLIDQGDMARGKLVTTSRVKICKLQTIHRTMVRKEVGALRDDVMRTVWKEFRSFFDL